jgi:hypothetical protein
VWSWRKVLGVTRTNNEGTQRLIHTAADLGAEAKSAKGLTPLEIEQRRQQALDMNLAQYLRNAHHEDRWTEAEMALLGTKLDEEVVKKNRRTVQAVRLKRVRLGIPNPSDSPRIGPRPRWTAEEDELALSLPALEVARRTGRTVQATQNRRYVLGFQSR